MLAKKLKRLCNKLFEGLVTEKNIRRLKSYSLYRELVLRQDNEIRKLQAEYAALVNGLDKKSALLIRERKYYSQNGEDGILLYIFSQIGALNKNFIEFGIEDGSECNAANLAINFGWSGLFIEGSSSLAEKARRFYYNRHGISPDKVVVANEFLTLENVNAVFKRYSMVGEIDLLSIDIDGNDYWIWQAIDVVLPRVVVIEYNASFGADRSITVEYDPVFDTYKKHPSGWYHGASLAALTKLAKKKNYILVGCESSGTNAFFVRADLSKDKFEPMSPADAFYPSLPRLRAASLEKQFELIKHLEYVEV
ncbi:MAG: hypothetical protein ACPMAG_03740 [Limisphaerales bacterium]